MAVLTSATTLLRPQKCNVCDLPLKKTESGKHSTTLDQIKKCGHVFHRKCLAQSLRNRALGRMAPMRRAECPEAECKEIVWFTFNANKLNYNKSRIYPTLPEGQVTSLRTITDVEERGPITRDAQTLPEDQVTSLPTITDVERRGSIRGAQTVKRAAYALTAIAVASFSIAFLSTFTACAIAAALFTIAAFSESRVIDWYFQVKDNSFQVISRAEQ
ncbi:hypothetical protein COB11_03300 [Candidatus Aerophobetes bacterium]|uniref:RING-type domain-containing protein n=1 Tax=Aerophobetes bacterium TaxID=2030807 RepID=A0A2A4YJ24_UNCAE|nr:MAG: hypothetical protein COB11_03300 [Candidatus Aerophobetes bacterium]